MLNRVFTSDKPNEKWLTDVSEFKYGIGDDEKMGEIYLSVILDLCGKRPVVFEYSDHNDNGPMEEFWGIMKREMYYGKKYKTKDELIKAIEEYMDYYTNKRVPRNLCILTPQEYYEKQLSKAHKNCSA